HARVDPNDPTTVYLESQDGNVGRIDLKTMERQNIVPITPERPKPNEPRYRFNWDTPIAISNTNTSTVYFGGNMLFKSTDKGVAWNPIGPDLTANIDRENLEMMGGKVPKDALSRHDGVVAYSTLTSIGESPLDPLVIYTGSDDGQVQVTRDGGKTWR